MNGNFQRNKPSFSIKVNTLRYLLNDDMKASKGGGVYWKEAIVALEGVQERRLLDGGLN